jgi:hypothetical protein
MYLPYFNFQHLMNQFLSVLNKSIIQFHRFPKMIIKSLQDSLKIFDHKNRIHWPQKIQSEDNRRS